MAQKTYIARKGEDADFAALTVDSLTINDATIEAGAVTLADDEKITLGTGTDVTVEWDTAATPDQLQFAANADDTIISFGVSAATQKSFDLKWFGNTANGADYLYFDASANLVYTTGIDLQFKDSDYLVFGTGSGSTGDVTIAWDGTDLDMVATGASAAFNVGATSHVLNTTLTGTLTVGVDDTGHDVQLFGATASAYLLWDESDDGLEVTGDARLDFSGATVKAANTDGGIIKAGTSVAPVTEDTADMKFVSMYFDDGATSGDARGIYNRLYITGAGGGGESLRSFTTVSDVAGATAHGAHLSLSLGASGSLTGQGIGTRSTLHMPTTALPASNVTYSALQAEIYSDGAASDPSGNLLSAIRIVNGGDATGGEDVDDDCAAFEFNGWTASADNMIGANTEASTTLDFANWVPIRIRIGTTDYFMVAAQTIAATGS